MEEEKLRTIWCGNLSSRVTEELLYELFLQAGPIEEVSVPKDKDGSNRGYAFITFKHECTVPYVIQLYEGTSLFDRKLRITPRGGGAPNQSRNSETLLMNPLLLNRKIGEMLINQQQISSNNLSMDSPKPASLLQLPFTMSPIPLVQASLRGQWSHSSPYQHSPPMNHRQDSNRRYQDRYQSNYYDRKRNDKNRNRRK